MRNLEEISNALKESGKADQLKALSESADAKRLGTMVDRSAVEKAVKSGDNEALRKLLGGVLASPEGQRMAEKLQRMMREK